MSKHGLNALLRKLTGSTQGNPIPSAQYIQEIWSNFAERLDAHWYLMGGVKETLRKLKDSGIRLVLVSKRAGKAAQQTREELKRYDLEEYFEEIYTGVSLDDYRGLLKEISQRLSRNPESIAVVSDWALDLRTARELGLKTIGVLSGVSTSSELKRGGADKIMKSVNELTVR